MLEKNPKEPLGYLVTRDGHSIPLAGLSPESVKAGASARNLNPNHKAKFKHQKALSAIPDQLGFSDGWTAYEKEHFPQIEQLLATHGCKRIGGLFPRHYGGCIDLFLIDNFIKARDLSDRLFNSGKPWPSRVFLGYGVDWEVWDRGNGHTPPDEAIKTIGGDSSTAAERASVLWDCRTELIEDWTFLGDALFGSTDTSELRSLYSNESSENTERMQSHMSRARARRAAFHNVFGVQLEGWVDIIKVTGKLAILKGCDGTWQPLWKGFRDMPPPRRRRAASNWLLDAKDTPSSLTHDDKDLVDDLVDQKLYNRPDVWDEYEAVEARKHFLAQGNSQDILYRTPELSVRADYLRLINELPQHKTAIQDKDLPKGFAIMPSLNGKRFALSDTITVAQFNFMLEQSGYLARRNPESDDLQWQKELSNAKDDYPACVCWTDAQAYCRWYEDMHHVSVWLPKFAELLSVRPCQSYNTMQSINSGNEESIASSRSFGQKLDWQESTALWQTSPASTIYEGISFFDSDDLFEFCQQPGQIVGRQLELTVPPDSDGSYKSVQVMFRLAIPLAGNASEVKHG